MQTGPGSRSSPLPMKTYSPKGLHSHDSGTAKGLAEHHLHANRVHLGAPDLLLVSRSGGPLEPGLEP